jgi:uncharacterized protein with HEPN domain
MKQRTDQLYLQHILDAISTIQSYLEGVDEEGFQASGLLQDGVIRQIQIVGEAPSGSLEIFASGIQRFRGATWPECGTSWCTTISAWTSAWFG